MVLFFFCFFFRFFFLFYASLVYKNAAENMGPHIAHERNVQSWSTLFCSVSFYPRKVYEQNKKDDDETIWFFSFHTFWTETWKWNMQKRSRQGKVYGGQLVLFILQLIGAPLFTRWYCTSQIFSEHSFTCFDFCDWIIFIFLLF